MKRGKEARIKYDRSLKEIEREIASQIHIAKLCFDICKLVPIIPGRGSDFLPYYYNLNYSKGILILHVLLVSNDASDLSIARYLKEKEQEDTNGELREFRKSLKSIVKRFKTVDHFSLRQKIIAHTDDQFQHTDFTSAYMLPRSLENYVAIIEDLKVLFFKNCNDSKNDNPHRRLHEQSRKMILEIAKT